MIWHLLAPSGHAQISPVVVQEFCVLQKVLTDTASPCVAAHASIHAHDHFTSVLSSLPQATVAMAPKTTNTPASTTRIFIFYVSTQLESAHARTGRTLRFARKGRKRPRAGAAGTRPRQRRTVRKWRVRMIG